MFEIYSYNVWEIKCFGWKYNERIDACYDRGINNVYLVLAETFSECLLNPKASDFHYRVSILFTVYLGHGIVHIIG